MRKIIFLVLFFFAFLERTFFDLGPNIELITPAMLLGLAYLPRKYSLLLVFFVLSLSDIFIGNSNIYLFTWSGFLIPAFILPKLVNYKKIKKIISKTVTAFLSGISANIFFFLWTNFGVWALDSWGMYSNDLGGLTLSYINALPFLKMHLTSTLLFVPAGFFIAEIFIKIFNYFTNNKNLHAGLFFVFQKRNR